MPNSNRDLILKRYKTILNNTSELDEWINSIDIMPFQQKIESMRNTVYKYDFSSFADLSPNSNEYRNQIARMYEEISGHTYKSSFEILKEDTLNIEAPYPYNSNNPQIIGENLLGVGQVLKNIPLLAPGKILEMGCGWGNTTLALARSNYHVTSIDIDPRCSDILKFWSKNLNCFENIKFINTTFDDFDTYTNVNEFDMVLFFKSFHHSLYFHKLAQKCYKALKPNGFIMLAAEPVLANYFLPWSIRCDGTSIYMIRKNGWMELGFDSNYFELMMSDIGFNKVKFIHSIDIPTMNLYLYQK